MGVTTNLAQTGSTFQYVPSLRTKAGEVTALGHVQPANKLRIVPVLQMMPQVSNTFATDFAGAWNGLPAILDGIVQTTASGSSAAFTTLFGAIGAAGVAVLPLIEIGATPTYMTAALGAQNLYSQGIAFRVVLTQLPAAMPWIAQLGLNPGTVDLIVDCGHVAEIDPQLLAPVVANSLHAVASTFTAFRSVTLSSSAAPKDASGLATGPHAFPRRDWLLWNAVSPLFPNVHFGDFGITHRDLSEPPGYAMANATVSPRYTIQSDWMLLKGLSTRGVNGQPMSAQYHQHAHTLTNAPYFAQTPGCWADGRIAQIAGLGGAGSSGNRETWVGIGLNRHLEFVCLQLP